MILNFICSDYHLDKLRKVQFIVVENCFAVGVYAHFINDDQTSW